MSIDQPPPPPPAAATPPLPAVWSQLPPARRHQLTALLATLLQRQLQQAPPQAQPAPTVAVPHE